MKTIEQAEVDAIEDIENARYYVRAKRYEKAISVLRECTAWSVLDAVEAGSPRAAEFARDAIALHDEASADHSEE